MSVHGGHVRHGQGAGTRALEELVREYFDLTPIGIINHLNLRRPIYRPTAAYGHFGRTDLDVSWEGKDMAGDGSRKAA